MVRWCARFKGSDNLDETGDVTRAVLPGSTTIDTVCWYIKKKQVSNQQVRIMSANFLHPWDVLELDIPEPELDQEPQAINRSPVGMVDIVSIFYVRLPSTVEGGP